LNVNCIVNGLVKLTPPSLS